MSALPKSSVTPLHPQIEIAEEPLPAIDAKRYLRLGILLVLIGFGGLLLWAGLAPLDKGVPVSGTVMVADNRKQVQPLVSGRVASLNVREGDIVQQGQVLLTLDSTQARSQQQNLQAQYDDALARQARLVAERDNLPNLQLPAALSGSEASPQIQTLISLQQQLLSSRRSALSEEVAAMRDSIVGSQARLQGLRASLQSNTQQYRLMDQQLQGLRPLARDGYIPRNRLLDSERQAAQMIGAIAQDNSNILLTTQQIQETERRILQRQAEYQKEVRGQLADVQLSQQDIGQRLKIANYDLENTQIRAPAKGIVVGLVLHTEGGVVGAGQNLMDVVPADQPLIIEARVPVQLIDKVHNDLPVELLFSAFNQNTTPRIAGQVYRVGADRLTDTQTGEPYYSLQVKVDDAGMKQLAGKAVRPGMPVEVFVRTGERSMLSYLFKPLADRMHIALTED